MSKRSLRAYPASGTEAVPNGGVRNHAVGGNFINVKSADQSFKIVVDDTYALNAEANRRFSIDEFKKVTVENDSGSTLNYQLEIGFGKIETDDVSIVGAIKVKNADSPDDVLTVDDPDTQTAIAALQTALEADIEAVTAMLQNDEDQRESLTDLSNSTHATVSNATTTLVTAGTNTNGIIIRRLDMSVNANSSGSSCEVLSGTEEIAKVTGISLHHSDKNIRLQSGVALSVSSSNANSEVNIFYEVL